MFLGQTHLQSSLIYLRWRLGFFLKTLFLTFFPSKNSTNWGRLRSTRRKKWKKRERRKSRMVQSQTRRNPRNQEWCKVKTPPYKLLQERPTPMFKIVFHSTESRVHTTTASQNGSCMKHPMNRGSQHFWVSHCMHSHEMEKEKISFGFSGSSFLYLFIYFIYVVNRQKFVKRRGRVQRGGYLWNQGNRN